MRRSGNYYAHSDSLRGSIRKFICALFSEYLAAFGGWLANTGNYLMKLADDMNRDDRQQDMFDGGAS